MEKPKNDKKIKEIKTPDYTRRAVDLYRKNKKMITITLTLQDYEKLKKIGIITAADVRRVLLDMIGNK